MQLTEDNMDGTKQDLSLIGFLFYIFCSSANFYIYKILMCRSRRKQPTEIMSLETKRINVA